MKRMWILFVVVAYPALALAQTEPKQPAGNYQPAVPSGSMTNAYGWPGYGSGGGTPAGNALNGMASAISASGDYNLATSAAAVNMTQAERNQIQNRQLWTNTYFEMRKTNRAARAAERGPAPTMEQIARMAKDGVPKSLTTKDVDPVTGRVAWPSLLQQDKFADQRAVIDQAFASRARYGALSYADQVKVREAADTMYHAMKDQIQQIPPPDYVACRSFLQSLTYSATKSDLE
jgi:hypothetical protein